MQVAILSTLALLKKERWGTFILFYEIKCCTILELKIKASNFISKEGRGKVESPEI